MLGPRCPHLFIAREFAARGGGLRSGNSSAFVRRKRNLRLVVRPCQAQYRAGNFVLLGWRQVANGGKRVFEKLCHKLYISCRYG